MRRAARSALLLFCGEAGSRAFGFLTTAVLARRLGVDGFGQIGFASAVFAYGVAATDLGLLTSSTRRVARDQGCVAGVAADVIPFRLALGLVAALVMAVVAAILSRPAAVRWLLMTYALGVVAQSMVVEWAFVGSERMGYVALTRTLTSATYFGLVLLAVRGPANIFFVPAALVVATLVGAATLASGLAKRLGSLRLRVAPAGWRQLLLTAWPIGLASALTQLHANIGLVGLGLAGSYAETGVYGSAYRLVFFLMTLDRIFYTAFFPAVSRVVVARPERLAELTGTAFRLILAVALPLCAGVTVLAKPAVSLLFGPQYAAAAGHLRVMVWFLPLSMLNSLVGYTLVAAGNERRFLRGTAIGVSVSAALCLVGIRLTGGFGAAVAIVCGEAAILCALFPDFLRVVRPLVSPRLAVPVAAAGVMAVTVAWLRHFGIAAAVAGGMVSYVSLLLLARGVERADLGLIAQR